MLRGWRPRYLLDYVTPAELPTDINALKAQQRRWATGSIQVAIKMLPRVLRRPDIGVFKKIQAALHLTHYFIHPLILVLTLLVLPLVLARGVTFADSLTMPLVTVMLVALFGPSTLYVVSQALTTGRWLRAIFLMPLLIGIGIGLAANNSLAVARALFGLKGGEFVRTPKLGAQAEDRLRAGAGPTTETCAAGNSGYRSPPSRMYLLEIFLGLWALVACGAFVVVVGPGSGLVLLVQALGFTSVGVLSLLHRHNHGLFPPSRNSS
jgi:hypothetical protein